MDIPVAYTIREAMKECGVNNVIYFRENPKLGDWYQIDSVMTFAHVWTREVNSKTY